MLVKRIDYFAEATTSLFTDEDRKFSLLINKLLSTLEAYTVSFVELGILKIEIKMLLESYQGLTPLVQIENICEFIKQAGATSPITKVLHFDFLSDLEGLKNNKDFKSYQKIYWD